MKTPAFLAPLLRRDPQPCALVTQRGQVVAARVHGAFDSATRKKGLLGRDGLAEGEALVIAPCNAVHTFFMRFPIDLVYLDREGGVVKVKPNVRPWRADGCWRGFAVVELPAGSVNRTPLGPGDRLSVVVTDAVSCPLGDAARWTPQ